MEMCIRDRDIQTLKEYVFSGDLFADCTGDATVGILAGADHRYGRENRTETGEPSAPENGDNLVMGTSNQWRTTEAVSYTHLDVYKRQTLWKRIRRMVR